MLEKLSNNILKKITIEREVDGEIVLEEIDNPDFDLILNAKLRRVREKECYPIINRGRLWYDSLTQNQLLELEVWYQGWLDVTDTHIIPEKPEWIDSTTK